MSVGISHQKAFVFHRNSFDGGNSTFIQLLFFWGCSSKLTVVIWLTDTDNTSVFGGKTLEVIDQLLQIRRQPESKWNFPTRGVVYDHDRQCIPGVKAFSANIRSPLKGWDKKEPRSRTCAFFQIGAIQNMLSQSVQYFPHRQECFLLL